DDPLDRFAPRAEETGAVLLYSCGDRAEPGWALEGGAVRRVVSGRVDDPAIRAEAFAAPSGPAPHTSSLGLWGYELGALVEAVPSLPRWAEAWPDFWRVELDGLHPFAPRRAPAPHAGPPPAARGVRAME